MCVVLIIVCLFLYFVFVKCIFYLYACNIFGKIYRATNGTILVRIEYGLYNILKYVLFDIALELKRIRNL